MLVNMTSVEATSRRGPVGNLPVESTSFVDRRRELAEVKRLLSASRLVTLMGIGGVGKTRLGLRLAADVRRAFTDGVWFVELDKVTEPDLVGYTVAATLGLREQSTESPLARLAKHLRSRHLLLMLDNCEHVIEATAVLTDVLLRSCPELRILATSRERLGLAGEEIINVPSLATPDANRASTFDDAALYDAVSLFVDRASSAVPGFQLTDQNYEAVAQIARELDGLPLAIELAAIRLRALSPDQLLDRMVDRFRLLSGRRGAGDRQRTLQASVEWSYHLCSPEEQTLWARSSAFRGGFDLDAVQAVCAGAGLPADLLEVVSALVDKSILLRADSGPVARYRPLETIREFGLERLRERGESDMVRRLHRDWFASLVHTAEQEWIGPQEAQWIARLSREHPNLRAAIEFSISKPGESEVALQVAAGLQHYWIARGLLSEGRHWLDRSLSVDERPSRYRVHALQVAAWLATLQRDTSARELLISEGRKVADQIDDEWARAIMLQVDGFVAMFDGDLVRADANLRAALRVFQARANTNKLVESLSVLVTAHSLLGDEQSAASAYAEFHAVTEGWAESSSFRCYALWALGVGACLRGDTRSAAEVENQSLQIAHQMDDRLGTAVCLEAFAWIAAAEGEYERSASLLGAADERWQAMGTSTRALPHLHVFRVDFEQKVRRALGERRFLRSWQLGVSWSEEEAFGHALRVSVPTSEAQSSASTTSSPLTPREREIAHLVAEGLSNKQIANKLVISPRTAETHVEHILTKLGFTSRAQIAALVAKQRDAGAASHP